MGRPAGRGVLVVLAACAMLAGPGAAQSPPAGAAPAPAVTENARRRAAERVEKHIAYLRRRLNVTEAQGPLFDAFADAMRQNAQRLEDSYVQEQARGTDITALDDLKSYAARERARAEDMERLVTPFAALYRAMTPEQQVNADHVFQEFRRRGRRGG